MPFNQFALDSKILSSIADAGYETPSEIQEKAIPLVLQGHDLRASAQTGTGKTAAFLLPALNLCTKPSKLKGKGPRVLILAPTRELAMQIAASAEKYSKNLRNIHTVCVSGGVPYHSQLRKLAKPCDILIATPGRLIDLVERKKVNFSRIELLVLDEADRMLDMGFVQPVKTIASYTPSERQTLLFSATLDKEIQDLSDQLLQNPTDVVIHQKHDQHKSIKQVLHHVDNIGHKNKLLSHILDQDEVDSCVIFTSTKRHASELALELKRDGRDVAALHGDMNQRQRTRTIQLLRSGKIKIVVATDVAARGIDVQSITHVINFDLPRNIEDYVHRIGRTGRAGTSGTAHSFAAQRDRDILRRIESFTGHAITPEEIPGLEPTSDRRFTPKKRIRKKGEVPFGPKSKSRFGEKKEGRFSEKREGRFGEKREKRFGDKKEGRFSDKRGSRFGDKREGRFGDKRENSFGEKREGRFGDKRESRFGDKRESRFSDKREGRFGDKREGRFGDKREGRFGEKREGRFGDKRENSFGKRKGPSSQSKKTSSFKPGLNRDPFQRFKRKKAVKH